MCPPPTNRQLRSVDVRASIRKFNDAAVNKPVSNESQYMTLNVAYDPESAFQIDISALRNKFDVKPTIAPKPKLNLVKQADQTVERPIPLPRSNFLKRAVQTVEGPIPLPRSNLVRQTVPTGVKPIPLPRSSLAKPEKKSPSGGTGLPQKAELAVEEKKSLEAPETPQTVSPVIPSAPPAELQTDVGHTVQETAPWLTERVDAMILDADKVFTDAMSALKLETSAENPSGKSKRRSLRSYLFGRKHKQPAGKTSINLNTVNPATASPTENAVAGSRKLPEEVKSPIYKKLLKKIVSAWASACKPKHASLKPVRKADIGLPTDFVKL